MTIQKCGARSTQGLAAGYAHCCTKEADHAGKHESPYGSERFTWTDPK